MLDRRKWALLLVGTVAASGAALAQQPLAIWEIDFDDPDEPSRWMFYRSEGPPPGVTVDLAPRSSSDVDGPKVLRIRATGKGDLIADPVLYRLFGEELRPARDSSWILDWEWKIKDVELSEGVSIQLMCANTGVEESDLGVDMFSHTRSTLNWRVFFDPANRFVHHRVRSSWPLATATGDPCTPVGVMLWITDPVDQTVMLSRLRVEERLGGTEWTNEMLLPRRIPPPANPFSETPLHSLRLATAGALEDLNGDGAVDLLALERRGYAHLYLNDRRGNFYHEVTRRAGLDRSALATGAMFLDLDGDGDRDLALSAEFDTPRLFENVGDLRFVEREILDDRSLGFWYGGAADDLDRDGDLDLLFVAPYNAPPALLGFVFLRNDGDWSFGHAPPFDTESLGGLNFTATFADLDQDGWPDAIVGREHLLRNHGGALRLETDGWVGRSSDKVEGTVIADFTADGLPDLLILRDKTESERRDSRLLVGDGAGHFTDRTDTAGLPALRAAEVALAEDFDNDGSIDLYICQRDEQNMLLLNDGSGRFSDATEAADFIDDGGCDSAVAGDLDGDGGMDIVILRYGSPPRVLRNRLPRGRWLEVILRGTGGNREAVGAEIRATEVGGGAIQTRWARRGRGFGSVGPSTLHLGLGDRQQVDLLVRFADGQERRLSGIESDRRILVAQSRGLLGSLAGRVAERSLPVRERFRGQLRTGIAVSFAIVACAFAVGFWLGCGPARWLAATTLVATLALASLLGAVPGRGWTGSPNALWLLGSVAGIASPKLYGVVRNRLRERPPLVRPPVEDLIRASLDFGHSGAATRTLLSVHGRVQNLFLGGEMQTDFLAELRELAQGFDDRVGGRIREFADLARATLPEIPETNVVCEQIERLTARLAELEAAGDDEPTLRRWRESVLPLMVELQDSVPDLMAKIDARCSCEVGGVLSDLLVVLAEPLRRNRIHVDVRLEGEDPEVAAVIARRDLELILENLFRNAIAALEGSENRRIDVTLRREGGRVNVDFRDSGPGIPPQHVEDIFSHGFSTKPDGGGYGLPRSREILDHYGGSIALIEGDLRSGAHFRITLRALSG